MKDYYAVLGIDITATPEAVKAAYRKLASKYHPDKSKAPNASQKFREVQEAYETLSQSERRQSYDDKRRSSLLENPFNTAGEIWSNYLEGVLK